LRGLDCQTDHGHQTPRTLYPSPEKSTILRVRTAAQTQSGRFARRLVVRRGRVCSRRWPLMLRIAYGVIRERRKRPRRRSRKPLRRYGRGATCRRRVTASYSVVRTGSCGEPGSIRCTRHVRSPPAPSGTAARTPPAATRGGRRQVHLLRRVWDRTVPLGFRGQRRATAVESRLEFALECHVHWNWPETDTG